MNYARGIDSDRNGARGHQPVAGFVLADAFDDWLEELGISLESFASDMMGSWVFNYAQALDNAGVRPVVFCISRQVDSVTQRRHAPTGARIVLLPCPKLHRVLSRYLCSQREKLLESTHGRSKWWHISFFQRVLRFLLTVTATPVLTLFREIRREGCRAILVQEYESARFAVCVLMGKLKGVRVFGTFTGGFHQKGFVWPPMGIVMRFSAGVVICATRELERFNATYSLPASKVTLLHYPVDTSVWYPEERAGARARLAISQAAQVVIYHGAIELEKKGLDVLIEAWEHIRGDRPDRDLLLVLIGTGTDSSALAKLIADRDVRGVCWLDRWVNDRELLRRYLSAADVYAFPSRDDAFGICVLEAMACGLPVVAGDAPGIPDIFSSGEDSGALIVPRGDAVRLGLAIGALLDDTSRARQLGMRSRQRLEAAFSIRAIGMKLRSSLLEDGR